MLLSKLHAMYICVLLALYHILADAMMEINENKLLKRFGNILVWINVRFDKCRLRSTRTYTTHEPGVYCLSEV